MCVCGRADLLPDEHAGDEESVQTQHAVQDVAQPRVVHHHRSLCGGFSQRPLVSTHTYRNNNNKNNNN